MCTVTSAYCWGRPQSLVTSASVVFSPPAASAIHKREVLSCGGQKQEADWRKKQTRTGNGRLWGRPMSWAATWLHTWPLEQNKAHDWIITNNTSDLMPWKHFSRHGTRPQDTRTGNSASGECTVSWHQLISARVRASADPGAMVMGNFKQYWCES